MMIQLLQAGQIQFLIRAECIYTFLHYHQTAMKTKESYKYSGNPRAVTASDVHS